MQTIVQVICSKGSSLRDSLVNDAKLAEFGFTVSEKLKPGRSKGWAKIHSEIPGRCGALNIEWDKDSRILLCRVINGRKGRPDLVVGDLISYLFRRHKGRIVVINAFPPE